MSAAIIMMMAMHQMQQNQRMMYESNRRMQEANRRASEAAAKKRKEEQRKLEEHRKNAPVENNGEKWQEDRIVKAISLQPSVNSLISTMEATKPAVIESEEKKYDQRILEAGYEYELLKKEIENDIETLRNLGISTSGKQYKLSRLTPSNTHIAKIEQATESFGNTFTINNNQPIDINPSILATNGYYEERYKEMNPEKVRKEYVEASLKISKYQRIAKYLKFILKTKKYIELEEEVSNLKARNSTCELRRKEMESYKSLTKEQLIAIRNYFNHLDSLGDISDKITTLFNQKAALRRENNEEVDALVLEEIMANGEYSDLVSEVYDYVSKIYANDTATMQGAYELVKGEYPINISRRNIYDLVIRHIKSYNKEDSMKLKLN